MLSLPYKPWSTSILTWLKTKTIFKLEYKNFGDLQSRVEDASEAEHVQNDGVGPHVFMAGVHSGPANTPQPATLLAWDPVKELERVSGQGEGDGRRRNNEIYILGLIDVWARCWSWCSKQQIFFLFFSSLRMLVEFSKLIILDGNALLIGKFSCSEECCVYKLYLNL